MSSSLHRLLLLPLLAAAAAHADGPSREDSVRAELEQQLEALVQSPAPEVELVFEGLEAPHLQLVEAEFLLDGKPLPLPPLAELARPGPHRVARVPVDEGTHALESRAVYMDTSPVFQSALSGFRWRLASRVTFHAQRGLHMGVRAIPGQVPEAEAPQERMKLVHEVVPQMMRAPLAAAEPPPAASPARGTAPRAAEGQATEPPKPAAPAVPATLLLEVRGAGKAVAATVRLRGPGAREVSTKGARGPREVELPSGAWEVDVLAPGFLAQTRRVVLEGHARVLLGFELAKAPRKAGVRQRENRLELLPPLQYPEGAIAPRGGMDEAVGTLVDAVVRGAIQRLRIEGHADNQEAEGEALSAARARALAEALERAGLPRERLESVGFGDSRPVAPNLTSRGRQFNRRVDLLILGP